MGKTIRRIAIVGMGILGKRHANAQVNNPKAELVAVCDLYEEQMTEFCTANPSVEMYSNFETMFAEYEVDMAIIATQDPYHKEPILAALAAGIENIICEKPLTTTLKDAEEVKTAAELANANIIIAFSLRMARCDRALRQLIKGGFLGKLLHGGSVSNDCIHVPLKLWGNKSAEWAKISSPTQFLFSHSIDFLRFYLAPAEVVKVYAAGKQEGLGSYCDCCDVILTWSDGTITHMHTDWTHKIPTLVENRLDLAFNHAGVIYMRNPTMGDPLMRIDFMDKDKMEASFTFLEKEGYKIHKRISQDAYIKYAIEMKPDENLEIYPASSIYILDYLNNDGFKGLDECIATLEDGIKQVQVLDAINRSMETDAPIYL